MDNALIPEPKWFPIGELYTGIAEANAVAHAPSLAPHLAEVRGVHEVLGLGHGRSVFR